MVIRCSVNNIKLYSYWPDLKTISVLTSHKTNSMTLISLGVDYGNTGYEEFMSKKIHTCSNSALVAVFEQLKKTTLQRQFH